MHRQSLILGFLCLTSLAEASSLEEVVVTANRHQQQVSDLWSNISIIDEATLSTINHTHINEAMQRVSGAWISRGNGQENLSAIRSPVLTGAGGCGAFLMTQDGIPLRAAGFCNVNELFESHSEIAARVEVIKGPGSALYGSNAMHGLVNVISPSISTPGNMFQLEGGPHDYFRAKLNHRGENWRVDISATTDGGYKNDAGFDQQKLTSRVQREIAGFATLTTLSMTNLHQETAGFIQGHDAYKDPDQKKQNPNPEAFRDARSARLYSTWEKPLGNDGLISLTPYVRQVDMTFLQHFLPGEPEENNGHRSIGLQTNWHLNDVWILGVDTELTQGFLKEYQATPTDHPSAFLRATIPQGQHYNYEVDAQTLALFGQYQLYLGERTKLALGMRYEWINYDYNNKMLDGRSKDDATDCGFGGCRFSRPADRSDSFINLSPKLGLTYELTEDHQLYLQLANGFRAPQTTELYRLQNSQTTSSIDSEELSSLELGLRGSYHAFSYDSSAYLMRKDNVIFRDTTRTNVDNGKTSHQGVELTLSLQLTDRLSSNLFFSYAKHQYENNPGLSLANISGNEIDTAPGTMGSMNIAWQAKNYLRAELEWVHLGSYYTNPENTAEYPGHDLLNLRISFTPDDNWSGFVRLMNLTDTDYAERADFAFGNERYFVGEPASIYLGVKYSL